MTSVENLDNLIKSLTVLFTGLDAGSAGSSTETA